MRLDAGSLLRRAGRKAIAHASSLVGRDNIAFERIARRNDLARIGSQHGEWTVPASEIHSGSICYCVGCGEDISFDLSLIQRFGCHVYALDPTPRAIDYVQEVAGDNPLYHFFPIGLWDKDETLRFFAPKNPAHVSHSLLNLQKTDSYIEVPVKRLKQVMHERGHERIDLLKLDIEGAEYKVVESLLVDEIDVGVLCVEFDEYFNPLDAQYRHRIRTSIAALIGGGYRLVNCRGNGNYTFVRTRS